jgi:citronellol/citronellal dehydrogenase
MVAAGGQALAIACDIRDEEQVRDAMARSVAAFGGIDILVNNASALSLTGTAATPIRRFDLMQQVNVRGTFLCTQHALPHLQRSSNAHVLNIAPPLNLDPRWFAPHVAYTIAKYGMSMCALGMAAEFAPLGIAVNCLWPRTVIATAALALLPHIDRTRCRTPEIMADAAHAILARAAGTCTGRFFWDEDVLRESGVADFSGYAVCPGQTLAPDLFV